MNLEKEKIDSKHIKRKNLCYLHKIKEKDFLLNKDGKLYQVVSIINSKNLAQSDYVVLFNPFFVEKVEVNKVAIRENYINLSTQDFLNEENNIDIDKVLNFLNKYLNTGCLPVDFYQNNKSYEKIDSNDYLFYLSIFNKLLINVENLKYLMN